MINRDIIYIIFCNNIEHSLIIQKSLLSLGIDWCVGNGEILESTKFHLNHYVIRDGILRRFRNQDVPNYRCDIMNYSDHVTLSMKEILLMKRKTDG